MRTLWNTFCFFAVVNLMALVMVLGWLWQTGRLTRERAQDIRAMLSTSVLDAKQAAEQMATQAEAVRLLQQAEDARLYPPAESSTQIAQVTLVHQQSADARRRLEDERVMLAQQLDQAAARMESQVDELRRQKDESRNSGASDVQKRKEEQFLRAVKHLEQVPAKQAKKILETLVAENNVEQAVAYLDAMNGRAAAKVLREFKSNSEIPLATELLERLRTRGVAQQPGDPLPSSGAQASLAPNALPNAPLAAGSDPNS